MYFLKRNLSVFIILVLLMAFTLNGQKSIDSLRTTNENSESLIDLKKTYGYYHLNDIYTRNISADTNINHHFLRLDPTRLAGNDHIQLSNQFTSSFPLMFSFKPKLGFNIGYNQYDVYNLNVHNFKFYTQEKPKTELFFSQLNTQQNISAGANFSRNFTSGLSISINYRRVSQTGFYTSQAVKTTNFGISLGYENETKNYNAFLTFIHNANDEEQNGGVRNIQDLFNKPRRGTIDTYITKAKTRHQERSLSLIQYFKLAGNEKWKVYMKGNLEYQPSYYKYGHEEGIKDTLYYGSFLVDTRGLRRYTEVDLFKTAFYLNGENQKGLKTNLGIIYDRFVVNDQNISTNRNDVTLSFLGDVPIGKSLKIDTRALLGIGSNVGNFDTEGSLLLSLFKFANLKLGIQLFASEPSYAQQNLRLNFNTIFQENYVKSLGSQLYGNLSIPKLKSKITLRQYIITNPIFWQVTPNSLGRTEISSIQSDDVLTCSILQYGQDFRIGNFHLDNLFNFQFFSSNIYNLPNYFSTHQLYWNGKMFKKALELNIGIEARVIPEYTGVGFSPLHGQFFSTENAIMPFFPDVDGFIMAKVSTFRIYFMMENAGNLFSKIYNFDVMDYPKFDPSFRFGIGWGFQD